MTAASTDLTGNWAGMYDFDSAPNPTPFECVMVQSGGVISGTITETVYGKMRPSTVSGSRSGSSISFLKLYDFADAGFDDVHYQGSIDSDGNEISGIWTIADNWSGTFIMVRNASQEEIVVAESADIKAD